MVFNATFNNISVIVAFSFIGGGNQNTTTDINKGLIVFKRVVFFFSHELHHECTHLLDYNKHQNQHYQTSSLWYQQLKYQLGLIVS
jgi:hypothetical protein